MRIAILYPKVGLESATALNEELINNGFETTLENPYETKNRIFENYNIVFKYGFSKKIKVSKDTKVLNKSNAVALSKDKLNTFELFKDDEITVPFTTDKNVAKEWIDEGSKVVVRMVTNGSNNNGLHFRNTKKGLDGVLTDAPLYTRYIPHTNEFRINCWRGKVMTTYNKIKNQHNFFKFKWFTGQEDHPELVKIAQLVYEKTKLDWYGLDVLRGEDGRLYLLEVNSCPVLFPKTTTKLIEAIKNDTTT